MTARAPGRSAAGVALGAALVAAGVWMLTARGIALPTRRPAGTLRFGGAGLVLLAAAPVLWGLAVAGIATGRLTRDAPWAQGLIAGGFAAGLAAFAAAQLG